MNPVLVIQILGSMMIVSVGWALGETGIVGTRIALEAVAISSAIGTSIFLVVMKLLENVSSRPKRSQTLKRSVATKIRRKDLDDDSLRLVRRRSNLAGIEAYVRRFSKLESKDGPDGLRMRLHRAGFSSDGARIGYQIAKLITPVLGVGIGTMFGLAVFKDITLVVLTTVISGLIGTLAVDAVINARGRARMARIDQTFPEALELIYICTVSGLTIDRAIERVTAELANRYDEIANEFDYLSTELRLLPSREQAYENFTGRVRLPIAQSFKMMLQQNEELGVAIADAMRELAEEARRERLLKAEKRAAKIPIIALLPLATMIMPAMFLVLLGPAMLSLLELFAGR